MMDMKQSIIFIFTVCFHFAIWSQNNGIGSPGSGTGDAGNGIGNPGTNIGDPGNGIGGPATTIPSDPDQNQNDGYRQNQGDRDRNHGRPHHHVPRQGNGGRGRR